MDEFQKVFGKFSSLLNLEAIRDEIDTEFVKWAVPKARQVLSEDRFEGKDYSVSADGFPVSPNSLEAASKLTIRNKLTINFIDETISIALREMKVLLSRAIGHKAVKPENDWINQPKVKSIPEIAIFIGRGKNKHVSRTTASEITDFAEGDIILLVPMFKSNVYLNARKFGGNPFMKKARQKIQSKLGMTKRTSPFRITAERSRAAFAAQSDRPDERGGKKPTPFGKISEPWVGSDSAWVIAIRRRKLN